MTDHDGTILVLGATGLQGGAVAAALRADGRPVRALVRDPAGPAARALAATGVETVGGDLGDPASVRAALTGVHGVFSVQPNSGQPGATVTDEDEVRFGTSVADLADRAGVAHLVYSSTVAAGTTSTGVPHLDTKSRVEAHLRTLDIPTTVVRPATFMELLLGPGTRLHGTVSFLSAPRTPVQFIAVRDIGRITARVFAESDRFVGRTLDIAGDALTGEELAEHLTRAAGRPIGYRKLPADVLAGDPVPGRLAELMESGRLAGSADLDALRAEVPLLLTFERWLAGPGAPLLVRALGPDGMAS